MTALLRILVIVLAVPLVGAAVALAYATGGPLAAAGACGAALVGAVLAVAALPRPGGR